MNDDVMRFERPCVGLDVHKGTTTATYLAAGGRRMKQRTFPTTRPHLLALARELGTEVPIVLEASTAGKAVATALKEAGSELHMAAPNKVALIAKAPVKTDERDSATLALLYQAGFLPECYIPPPEIDRLLTLVRARQDLGIKATLVKNQVHALVTRNLLDEEMEGTSDWFGVGGIRKLTRLPLPPEDRGHLARALEQLNLLAEQEGTLQSELAKTATERADVQLLMTIPGVDYYTAVAIVAEIGDIHRFANKKQLCSHAGVVPRADNSGERVSQHRSVKKGDMVLKRFLCIAVQGMLRASRDTSIKRFYEKKAKSIGAPKAQIAAARKLACAIWWMLTHNEAFKDEDE
ncbi:MAG: IS110 family transposase, partial [Thermoplasmata archaeon]